MVGEKQGVKNRGARGLYWWEGLGYPLKHIMYFYATLGKREDVQENVQLNDYLVQL